MPPVKPLLIILNSFLVALASFGAGLYAAILFFTAEPTWEGLDLQSDASVAWTSEPVPVDRAAQDLERLPPRTVRLSDAAAPQSRDDDDAQDVAYIDETITAGIPAEPANFEAADTQGVVAEADGAAQALSAEHVAWCADRYRSYRPRDNSYTPYSGGRRECTSPFSQEAGSVEVSPLPSQSDSYEDEAEATEGAGIITAAVASEASFDAHAQDCMSRYRSYRIEDNTYQPYGGGPRLQCQ
jgi:hypothetical protein